MSENKLSKQQSKELLERIGGSFKDQTERAHTIFEYLNELPRQLQVEGFEMVLSGADHPDTPASGKRYNLPGLSEEATERHKIGLGKLIDGNFQFCLAKRPTAKELAEHMWEIIEGLDSDEEKIFSISWLLIDRVLPYIQIPQGGVKLNNETFKVMVGQMKSKIRMIEAIMKWPHLQNTERMSLSLGVILDETTVEERAVLLTALMAQISNDTARAMKIQQT